MLTITINGESRPFETEMHLSDLLKQIGINERFIAVAYNGSVLRRDELEYVTLRDGDVLELVHPVGGG